MNRTFRFFFLAASLALLPFAPASASSSAGDDVIRGPYEPTRFGDNTFIDVQGGVNAFGASNMTGGDVWSSVRPSAALGVSFGKWFVPSVGLRVGWQGLMSNWAPGADFSPALPQMRGWYNYAHADLLVDCCNWFGGYRRERTWSVVPYLSVGAAWNYIPPVDGHDYNYVFVAGENPVIYSGICSVAFGAGLYNRFRISDRVGITLDIRAVAHDRDLLGEAVNYGIDRSGAPVHDAYKARGMEIFGGNLSAMVGLCISLGSVGWKRRGTPDDAISSAGAPSSSVSDFAAVPVPSAVPVQPAPSQDATPPCTVADGDAVKAADDGEPLARAVETGGTPDKAIADGSSPVTKDTVKLAEEARPEPLPSESRTEELFGWQIMSGKARVPSDDRCFLGYEPTVVEVGGGILKYVIGVSDSPAGAYENKVEIRKKYPDAFLVRISNGVSPYYYKP